MDKKELIKIIRESGLSILARHYVTKEQIDCEDEALANKILALDKTDKEWCECKEPLYPYKLNKPPYDKLCGKCKKEIKPSPVKVPERLNIPVFVHDYFMRGEHSFVGEALQCLNDHIGMLETKTNELIAYLEAQKEGR